MPTSNLIPTQITDKNGKRTTVRKRADGVPAKMGSVPPPAKPASTGTLLRKPRPLKEQESWVWIQSTWHSSYPSVMADAEALEPDTKAIAKDLRDREVFDHAVMARMITVLSVRDGFQRDPAMEQNFLLVSENLARQGRNLTTHEDQYSLMNSLRGTYFIPPNAKRKPTEKVTTQEELDVLTAITQATSHWERMANEEIIKPWRPKNPLTGTKNLVYTIRSRELVALISERPYDVDRIISYIDSRSGRYNKPVSEIREFLDSTAGTEAVAEGWL